MTNDTPKSADELIEPLWAAFDMGTETSRWIAFDRLAAMFKLAVEQRDSRNGNNHMIPRHKQIADMNTALAKIAHGEDADDK